MKLLSVKTMAVLLGTAYLVACGNKATDAPAAATTTPAAAHSTPAPAAPAPAAQKTAKELIIGSWNFSTINGQAVPPNLAKMLVSFTNEGVYTVGDKVGKWSLSDDNKKLLINLQGKDDSADMVSIDETKMVFKDSRQQENVFMRAQ